jgi:hypothetical protein
MSGRRIAGARSKANAIAMNGRMMIGCRERTHSTRRSVKNAAV